MPRRSSGRKRSSRGTSSSSGASDGRRRRDDGVERRVGEQQGGRHPAVVVPQPQRGAGGQVAAGAGAAERDPVGVDAEGGGVVAHPADGGDDVVVRHRVGHAADAEAVVDADDDGAGPLADLPRGPVGLGHVQVAHPERAAVQPDQAGQVGAAPAGV